MSYSTVGAADTEWCSPANPQGSCKPQAGLCKPMFSQAHGGIPTLEKFKAFQSQLNRFASPGTFGSLKVDGQIGPLAVAAVNRVLGTSATSCEQVARLVETLTSQLETKAALTKLPPPAPIPPSRPVRQPGGSIREGNPGNPGGASEGSLLDKITEFATSPMGLVAGAAVVGLLIYSKRKKGAAAPAASASTAVAIPKVG
jgi:hypothetical protein